MHSNVQAFQNFQILQTFQTFGKVTKNLESDPPQVRPGARAAAEFPACPSPAAALTGTFPKEWGIRGPYYFVGNPGGQISFLHSILCSSAMRRIALMPSAATVGATKLGLPARRRLHGVQISPTLPGTRRRLDRCHAGMSKTGENLFIFSHTFAFRHVSARFELLLGESITFRPHDNIQTQEQPIKGMVEHTMVHSAKHTRRLGVAEGRRQKGRKRGIGDQFEIRLIPELAAARLQVDTVWQLARVLPLGRRRDGSAIAV